MNISMFFSVGSLILCVLMFFYFKWYVKRKISQTELSNEHKTEAYRLIAEIDSVTDRNLLLVEDTINKLKELKDDTDKRISIYMKELEKSRTSETLYSSLGRGIRAALREPAEPPPVLPAQSVQVPPIVPVSLASQVEQSQPEPVPPPPPSKAQIRAQLDELILAGHSPGEIASRLGISAAEVNLAMNLLNRNVL